MICVWSCSAMDWEFSGDTGYCKAAKGMLPVVARYTPFPAAYLSSRAAIPSKNYRETSVDTCHNSALIANPLRDNFMYAVLETGSKQYRVAAGDTLEIER